MNEAFTELLVTVVLGLYPREWRKRYGGEVRELIHVLNAEHRRSLARMLPSLIAGATVERLYAFRRLDRTGAAAALLVTVAAVGGTLLLSQRIAAEAKRPAAISSPARGFVLEPATTRDLPGK